MKRSSIFGRLTLGLTAVGLVGALVLLIFVTFEYGLLAGDASSRLTLAQIMTEVSDHVVLPLIVLILPLAIAVPWAIHVSLNPLRDAAAQIELAESANRGFRVDASAFPAEALRFAEAVNGLLGRLDQSAARQEAFAADVAHELRTPLAILALELDRLNDADAARLKKDVTGMSRLVDQLLVLAQLDAQAAAKYPMEAVALESVAADVITQLAPLAMDEGKEIALETVEDVGVQGRPEAIGAAVRNLVENGLRVTPRNGTVVVIVGPGRTIRVRDGGPGLSEEALSDYRQRLHRGDQSSKTGAGLGLAIVSRIMEAHEGSLRTDPSHAELILDFSQQA